MQPHGHDYFLYTSVRFVLHAFYHHHHVCQKCYCVIVCVWWYLKLDLWLKEKLLVVCVSSSYYFIWNENHPVLSLCVFLKVNCPWATVKSLLADQGSQVTWSVPFISFFHYGFIILLTILLNSFLGTLNQQKFSHGLMMDNSNSTLVSKQSVHSNHLELI